MRSSSRTVRMVALLVAGSMAATACSASVSFNIGGKSPEAAAAELIEGELAEQIGIELAAECPDLQDPQAGDVFNCTGSTPDGAVIDFVVDITDDEVFANSLNMLVEDAVPGFEDSIVGALNEGSAVQLPNGSVDCGSGPLVVPRNNEVLCRLSDPQSNDVYDTIVTITDQETWQYSVSVADDPS